MPLDLIPPNWNPQKKDKELMELELSSIDEKRVYIPEVDHKCDKCNKIISGGGDYFSYPQVGKEQSLSWYCYECDYEMEQNFTIKAIVIELEQC